MLEAALAHDCRLIADVRSGFRLSEKGVCRTSPRCPRMAWEFTSSIWLIGFVHASQPEHWRNEVIMTKTVKR